MSLPITAIFASLLALLFFRLSIRVIELRRSNKVSLGDGGHEDLKRAVRGQANCAEYGPIAVMLILIAELQSPGQILTVVLAVLAAAFLLGRVMHGYAFAATAGSSSLRVRGMQLTLLPLVLLAILNIAILIIQMLG